VRSDPDNRLLSHQNVRRLEAETIRDALLAVSGKLNPKLGGTPAAGDVHGRGTSCHRVGHDGHRLPPDRKVRPAQRRIPAEYYVQVRRTRQLDMFATFDAPSMTDANCDIPPVTTVSPQSLLLERITPKCGNTPAQLGRAPAQASPEKPVSVDRLRQPAPEELANANAFLTAQTAFYRENPAKLERVTGPADKEPAAPELLGLTALCHAVMSANEFLYLD